MIHKKRLAAVPYESTVYRRVAAEWLAMGVKRVVGEQKIISRAFIMREVLT